ncbi:hypothetical protein Goshw_027533 [Gossypium schwendimanii]|uniref:Uncharacterized protein n=1 Tax=Gossypium schwendimanii TaxID=34291 RepID=A0A7J9LYR3_GOSSC|nr:hypothetical protein [Gossypium schwendimanii]
MAPHFLPSSSRTKEPLLLVRIPHHRPWPTQPPLVPTTTICTPCSITSKIKWCPATGCEYAVDFTVASGNLMSPASAHIAFCIEKAHRYVDCKTGAKWILKNSAESENMDW